jgi:hypothetical protein
MLVQTAVGAALAMFLREWHLEDMKKMQELRAAEAAAAAEQDEKNETEFESGIESGIEIDNQDIDNSNTDSQDNNNIENIENNVELPDDNFNNTVESESQVIEDEIIATEDNETNLTDQNDEPEQEINIPETAPPNIPTDFQVDEIIDNMLSESTSDMASDIIEQIVDLAASSELPDFPEAEIEIDGVEGDTTNITLSPDEYNNDTNNPQNISQTVVEILGENFDFDSLLAESKVIDITETENNQNAETNFESVEDKPKQFNYTVAESIDNIPANSFECIITELPMQIESFTCESQEIITTFTPDLIQKNNTTITEHNQSFTEFPPPIYKRKKKKN